MILLIDNYDSFTYNLRHYLGELGAEVEVRRNDALTSAEALAMAPQGIVISPGPCDPDRAGICLDLLSAAAGNLPVLGVCLGHQCIVQQQGGNIVRAEQLMHGKTSQIKHDGKTVFEGISEPFEVGRYHSLCAETDALPDVLQITAETDSGVIMGVRHKSLLIEGVQFHPESVLTPEGETLMTNFMRMGESHD